MHEILERSFKFRKTRAEREAVITIMKNLRVYQHIPLPDILHQRRKMITEKRVYRKFLLIQIRTAQTSLKPSISRMISHRNKLMSSALMISHGGS